MEYLHLCFKNDFMINIISVWIIFRPAVLGGLNLFCAVVEILHPTSPLSPVKIHPPGIFFLPWSNLLFLPSYEIFIWSFLLNSGLFSGNIWRNFSSWMPQRETAAQVLSQSPLDDFSILFFFLAKNFVLNIIFSYGSCS